MNLEETTSPSCWGKPPCVAEGVSPLPGPSAAGWAPEKLRVFPLPSKTTVLGKGCVTLAYSRKKHPRSKQQKSGLGLGVLLQFFFFFLQCLNRVLPEANAACGKLQVLSYSSVRRRRRRKVGSETRVEKHSLKKAGETSLPWFVVGVFFSLQLHLH